MEFSTSEVVFLVILSIYFLFRDLKRRFQVREDEIDRVLAEAEQVKYKNMVREVMFCKSEIVNGQIFVYEKDTSAFITQQPDVESMFKFFIKNYPNKRIQFGE
jgi:hypothetical protein